jgi:dipeptidyl aminopeptidase/acylaminoacyl peptidase
MIDGNPGGDVEGFDVSPDGNRVAVVTNVETTSSLLIIASPMMLAKGGLPAIAPKLPLGVITGVRWHENSQDLGFTMTSARSPTDAWSFNVNTEKLERWTESETGGLDTSSFVEPEGVHVKSFDGKQMSGLLYLPKEEKFPGKRPVIINIHGGPEGQSRPIFQARNNYFLEELGVAILYPNVRGSDGFGKSFLAADNGFKREDSVKDIGAFLDYIEHHERLDASQRLDASRIAVIGGSYGGFMVLSCMIHYNDRLRCGCDVVGISNFLTFLANTSGYRRDLRRVEYGDERDPKMAESLKQISPMTHAAEIKKPLFIVQGKNDPRVPLTEAEQMVKAVRAGGTPVWYLMAADEGHGFAKKKNADFQFYSTILFFREHLLGK